nr:conserved hypothetical protein [Ipomoea batatas]
MEIHTALDRNSIFTGQLGEQRSSILHWNKPESGWIAVNVDGSSRPRVDGVEYPMEGGEDNGKRSFVAAVNGPVDNLQNPLVAEAMGCREALS